MRDDVIKLGMLVPGLPHPLLCPEKNKGWSAIRDGFEVGKKEIEESDADLLIIYSTYWPSVLGHQIQAKPNPEWTHVDEEFHELGSMPYKFKIDSEFARQCKNKCEERGLHARTVAYDGFPIDTGSVVALKLLNPKNSIPAIIISSNVYANRSETVVLGKALRDAVREQKRKAVAVVVGSLSNRLITTPMNAEDDKIHSSKDDEWNRKFLEYLEKGRLEDVSQLSRQFHQEARVPKVVSFKPFWWLSAIMGQSNLYSGKIHAYEPIIGTGGAVVSLTPVEKGTGDLEYDEENPEVYEGDLEVLDLYRQVEMGTMEKTDGD